MSLRSAKACWQASTVLRRGTPLSMGRMFWLWRSAYYLFGGK